MNFVFSESNDLINWIALILVVVGVITALVAFIFSWGGFTERILPIIAVMVGFTLFVVGAIIITLNENEQKLAASNQVRSEIERVYGGGVSEDTTKSIRDKVAEIDPQYDSPVLDDITVLVDGTTVNTNLVYEDGEYRLYILENNEQNIRVELERV